MKMLLYLFVFSMEIHKKGDTRSLSILSEFKINFLLQHSSLEILALKIKKGGGSVTHLGIQMLLFGRHFHTRQLKHCIYTINVW